MTTTIKLPKTAKLLTKVRDLLVNVGWTQGTYQDDRGYCLVGAIHHVVTRHGLENDELMLKYALWNATESHYELFNLINWNDVAGRTFKEVLEVIDKAIAHEIAPQLERR